MNLYPSDDQFRQPGNAIPDRAVQICWAGEGGAIHENNNTRRCHWWRDRGCSALYHLTREGWTDVVLVERDELTSGSTWHSAAQVTNFGMNQTMIGFKSHSIALYSELAADPDYPINYHHADGGIRLANTERQMEAYSHFASMARGMGVHFEVIDAEECARRHPLVSTDNLLGGLWDPLDGDIDPAQLCQALARRARKAGAEIYRQTPLTGLTQHADDGWTVHTGKGDIDCEIVVNASGYRVNEIGALMGVHHLVMSMEHQYFVTGPIQQIIDAGHRMPLLRCPISDYYCRQEKQGLLLGFYEQDCRTWGMDGIDPNFTNALCPDDLDRVTDAMEGAFARMPALMEAGIHTVVNGPITYTIDGTPLVGPIPGKRNAFGIIGLRAGLGEGGGHGWLLAQQIVHGEACYDTWCLDPRRFAGEANVELTALKAIEEYQNEFRFHYPHEHRPAGRPCKTTPLTPVLAPEGAEFGVVNGWERVAYFRPDPGFTETHSFRFTESFPIVGAEVRCVQEAAGLAEVNGFNRIEITGDGIHDWLDGLFCGRISRKPVKVGLGYMLNHHGNVKAEATLANLDDGCVWYGSAAASEIHDMEWLAEHLPADGSIRLNSLTNTHTTLILAGPKARAIFQKVTRINCSPEAFGWLQVRQGFEGIAPAVIMSVSFSGEQAFEIHLPNNQLHAGYLALRQAGEASGMGLFGSMAIESMRMEKGYLHWKADLITEFKPFESGLGRFVQMDKDFIGRTALQQMITAGPRKLLVSLYIACDHAPGHPGASVCADGDVVGTVTSAAWGHRVGKNMAYAFVDPAAAHIGDELTVDVLGLPVKATVIDPCTYDLAGDRVKGG